jgi:predicted DNA repair protein MutK
MAGSSLLMLIDDIASVLDDVTILSKVAAKNTAGVLGDDLALNAEQVSGVRAEPNASNLGRHQRDFADARRYLFMLRRF